MPPVRVMGPCCQAECPTSEAITWRAIAVPASEIGRCRANSLTARCGNWEPFVQTLSVTFSAGGLGDKRRKPPECYG